MHTRTFAIPFALVVALTLALPTLAFQVTGVWQQINTPSTPGNLDGHSLVVIDNDVYLFGGHDVDAALTREDLPWRNSIYVHSGTDLSTGWRKINLPEPQPPGRAFHAAAAVDGKMVINGGLNGGATPLSDTWVFDPQTMTWSQKTTATTPPGLAYHKAVVSGGKVYLVGGITSGGGPSDELWAYDSTASSWTQKASYPGPYGGAYATSVFATGSGIMVGGMTGDTYYVYNPGTNSWDPKTTTGFPNREAPGTAQAGSTGYIFGGRDTSTYDYVVDSWKADLSQDPVQWEPLPPNMPNAKADICLIPEAHSPTTPSWMAALPDDVAQQGEPAVLLYGQSWTYPPGSHNPVMGDAATWVFWPSGSPAGPLDGIVVWPEDAVVAAEGLQVFNATGHDANGFYVPITPTWGATGGVIDDLGRYTAGDLPGVYYVAAEVGALKIPFVLRDQVPVTVTGTETCPDLPPGSSWSHTFAYTGSFPYHDRVGPDHYSGTVVVDGLVGRAQATHDVSITATGFDPNPVIIAQNDTVRWTNNHTETHAIAGGEYKQVFSIYLPLAMKNF